MQAALEPSRLAAKAVAKQIGNVRDWSVAMSRHICRVGRRRFRDRLVTCRRRSGRRLGRRQTRSRTSALAVPDAIRLTMSPAVGEDLRQEDRRARYKYQGRQGCRIDNLERRGISQSGVMSGDIDFHSTASLPLAIVSSQSAASAFAFCANCAGVSPPGRKPRSSSFLITAALSSAAITAA